MFTFKPQNPIFLSYVVKGKKYFFKNRFETFQKDFSNFEAHSLAVSKFRKT